MEGEGCREKGGGRRVEGGQEDHSHAVHSQDPGGTSGRPLRPQHPVDDQPTVRGPKTNDHQPYSGDQPQQDREHTQSGVQGLGANRVCSPSSRVGARTGVTPWGYHCTAAGVAGFRVGRGGGGRGRCVGMVGSQAREEGARGVLTGLEQQSDGQGACRHARHPPRPHNRHAKGERAEEGDGEGGRTRDRHVRGGGGRGLDEPTHRMWEPGKGGRERR